MYKAARRLFVSLGLAVATAVAPMASTAQAQIPYLLLPTAQAKYSAIVVDAKTGEVLYAKRADSPRYPASITKVMTLYLTFEALAAGKIKLDDPVQFSPRAAAQAPTKLGLSAGDSITVSEAMQAMAIKSANDVAVAMAERLGGTESRFAALMTLRAQELGMVNTHFVNASGLPDSRQMSTSRDIAILSRAVMRDYPQYYRLFSQQTMNFRGQTLGNHNRLLGRMTGVDGLKTGYTNASGYNLAVSAVRDGRRLIAVVMGGSSNAARDDNAEDLLLTGFDVMARRARGEKITIAQNMFEPPASSPILQSTEQGDSSDNDSVKIVLASAVPTRALGSKPVEPARPAKKGEPAKKAADAGKKKAEKRAEAKGKWIVQVGAFASKADAKEQLDIVKKRFGKYFADAKGTFTPQGKQYRARFAGLTEDDAKDACKAMKAKKQVCMVVPPA